MADTKFKVGEPVKVIKLVFGSPNNFGKYVGTKQVIEKITPLGNYNLLGVGGDWRPEELELISSGKLKPEPSPKFILQYELDRDPFEFFATEKEARKRIAELAERTDLKRDSIRLIEIKKIRTVKLGVKITIGK